MTPEDLHPSQRLHLVRAEGGYRAFLPPPLPPRLTLDAELVGQLSAADRAVGELAGLVSALPDPGLLSRPLIRREAVLSSRIEGTRATSSELSVFQAGGGARDEADVAEVANYVVALDHVLDPRRRLPLSLPLLLEAHALLMRDVRGGYATPGVFRRSQNWIGRPGSTLADAAYVPPPPERLWECLDALEKYLHAYRVLPPLLEIAAIHYQFEAVHPFVDGNGRVGRLLVSLLLVEWGVLPAPVLDLSAWLEPRRDRYYAGLLTVSTQGDWRGWFLLLLEAFEEQSRDAAGRARALQALRERYRARLAADRAPAGATLLLDELFRVPAVTLRGAQRLLGVTHRAATLTVQRLVRLGVLEELERQGVRRRFLARGVLDVADGR